MSVSQPEFTATLEFPETLAANTGSVPVQADTPIGTPDQRLDDAIRNVAAAVAPVWPLKDYVAVNPYLGLSDRPFLKARRLLRTVCDCETLMPLSYYRRQFQKGAFREHDIKIAVDEMTAQESQWRLTVTDILRTLTSPDEGVAAECPISEPHRMRTLAEFVDQDAGTDWSETIREEIGKHCAAHYDEGQASWPSPWQHLSLYEAWRSVAQCDRRLELLGLSDCCQFIANLPHTPQAALAFILDDLRVPEELWELFLLCQAHSIGGWSSWAKYQTNQDSSSVENQDFIGLLAIRLAYDAAISRAAALRVDWQSIARACKSSGRVRDQGSESDVSLRFALLRATEVAFQRRLLGSLASVPSDENAFMTPGQQDCLAQLVFCIDVRSERYRRNLENVCAGVQTFGFAGFFGMPIAFRALGEEEPSPQVPALLSPSFTVAEGLGDTDASRSSLTGKRRGVIRLARKSWKQFQASAVGCFGFVETSGLAYGWKLFHKSLRRRSSTSDSKFDGVHSRDRHRLGPVLSGLEAQGIGHEQQVDLAESALRGIGLTQDFAKLVVFCGHGSETQNNPLQAGLDCGACCGHSGEPNARFAAALLNLPDVRAGLSERGIDVPAGTRFVAALHNTTNDEIRFFEAEQLPDSLRASLEQLVEYTTEATGLTQLERLPQLRANNANELLQRTLDWSEVRPEWGLAGNAAFIVAPREVTRDANLDGRSFLHSYDYHNDKDFTVLEQIMTAPLVVGHWINMQYYASTVDNRHYGSGSKTIHNVVGRFGILSGNGGDLTTGLPWQSVHDGKEFQHEPLRLLAVIAAPRDAVADIIERNKVVEDLLVNGWLNLVVLEDGEFHQYTTKQSWRPLATSNSSAVPEFAH